MPFISRRRSLAIVLLLCASLGLWAVQKRPSTSAGKAEAAATPQPIAVHEFHVEGVDVALMEVIRTAPEVVTVKWEYRNKTDEPQKLAGDSKGWSDPYRLCLASYLLGSDGVTKFPVFRDEKRVPVAAAHGRPNQVAITLEAGKTLKTWAKYAFPAGETKATVVIPGADPFESVKITEPPPDK